MTYLQLRGLVVGGGRILPALEPLCGTPLAVPCLQGAFTEGPVFFLEKMWSLVCCVH